MVLMLKAVWLFSIVALDRYIDNQTVELDSNFTAWAVIKLDNPVSCYDQVLAFDIEAGGNVSDLAVMANLTRNLAIPCTLTSQGNSFVIIATLNYAKSYSIHIESMVFIIIVTSVAVASIVFVLALILVIGLILQCWNKSNNIIITKN